MVQITPEEVMAQRLAKVSAPKRIPVGWVYRLWAKDGTLLYIGKTIGPWIRPRSHYRQPWGGEIDKITHQEYPSEPEAFAAEREAIIREKPKYNKRMTYATRLTDDQIVQMHRALDVAQTELLKLESIDPKISKLVIQEAKNRVMRAFRQ